MSKTFLNEMREIFGSMPSTAAQPEGKAEGESKKDPFEMFDEARLREKGLKLGEGVTYVSGEKIETGKMEGYKAVYAFKDINNLKLNQNPGENVPSGPGGKSESSGDFVNFRFLKGDPSSLTITMTSAKNKAPEMGIGEPPGEMNPQPDEKQEKQMMEQAKQMFQEMKLLMAVDVQGPIVETNATHVNGSRITLMEIDFDALFRNEEKFREFALSQFTNMDDAKMFMQMIPGFKVELNEEVTVKFR